MNKGVIIHLDNDKKGILEPGKTLFSQMEIDLDLVSCETEQEFNEAIIHHKKNIKALIFDIHDKEPKEGSLDVGKTEFLKKIEETFALYNIPIFIYSGYLPTLNDKFNNYGTVFKIDKSEGLKLVYNKIKLFLESGFIDVFSPGGILETEIHKELHNSFVKQFQNNIQIETIISNIQSAHSEIQIVERIKIVFKRIAVRSLLSSLCAPEIDEDGNIKNIEFAGHTEHYLQRLSGFEFWTGDIWKQKNGNNHLLIITPRCNVASKSYSELLVCDIETGSFPEKVETNDDKKKLSAALTGNPSISGYDRYLPASPLFVGGKVLLSKYKMFSKVSLKSEYTKLISLSDELTNEILGKFGAYFFRTGIMPWDEEEVIAHVKSTKEISSKENHGKK